MSKKITTKDFINKYSLLNKPVEIIGEYVNCKTKIDCKCLLCGEKFLTTPDHLMRGCIHKSCAMKIWGANKTSTTEQFKQKLKQVNENIIVIGEYINAKEKIKVKCLCCDYEWNIVPNNLLNGQGCPKCQKHIVRSIDELYLQIQNNPKNDVEILSPIKRSYEKISVKCNICGHIWEATPIGLIRNGCPNCDLIKRTKPHKDFMEQVHKVNKDIIILEKYKNAYTKIKCKCKNNHIWYARPDSLLKGYGCTICNESKGESYCKYYFNKNNINYIHQKKFENLVGVGGKKLSYDFYIPKFNVLVEYNGEQHYEPVEYFGGQYAFSIQQEHDKRKSEYAKCNNIKLIVIPYWDYGDIEEILSRELGI